MPNNLISTQTTRSDALEMYPLSVERLTSYIEQALTQTPHLRQVWVSGEVSSMTSHPSGIYFTLKDPVGKAVVPAVIWKNQIPELETKPQVGTQILAFGKITVYAPHGKYQFQVQQVLPVGEGLQALRLQKLKERLSAEGIFDQERKLSLPAHPQTIAVVTSPQAAAWGDIQKTLLSRYPGIHVLLSPATVQGETAPGSIERAIDRVQLDGRAAVIILARGGGATEDLSCFNSEIIVRSIAECTIPIVTGIGHERDESLADLVADVRATTPTAAAAVVVPALTDLWDEHQDRVHWARSTMQKILLQQQNHLKYLRARCERIRPDRQIELEADRLAGLQQRLKLAICGRLAAAEQEQLRLQERSQALDPALVLQRGYAVVRENNGAIVRDSDSLVIGDELNIQFGNGQAKVRVIEHGQK
jgi:exodeoxyribonuclease VII large subunit